MVEVGSIAVKLSGRDAGEICVVVEDLGNNFVLIEGNTRRRKCNILHLQPLGKSLNIKKGDSHANIINALKNSGIQFKEVKKGEKRENNIQIAKKRANKSMDNKVISEVKSNKEDNKKLNKKNSKEIKK